MPGIILNDVASFMVIFKNQLIPAVWQEYLKLCRKITAFDESHMSKVSYKWLAWTIKLMVREYFLRPHLFMKYVLGDYFNFIFGSRHARGHSFVLHSLQTASAHPLSLALSSRDRHSKEVIMVLTTNSETCLRNVLLPAMHPMNVPGIQVIVMPAFDGSA